MGDLKELAERLKKATGNLDDWRPDGGVNSFTTGEIDRWSNALFGVAACTNGDEMLLRNALKGSVDASLELVERLLPQAGVIRQDKYRTETSVSIETDEYRILGTAERAPTTALALLRALVAALIAQEKMP